MSGGGALMKSFLSQELNGSVRSILEDAINDRVRSKRVLLRDFEFNCFDVFWILRKASLDCKMPFPLVIIASLIFLCMILYLPVI